MLELPTKVEVTFRVGSDVTVERYSLDNLSDITTWRANETLTAATQLGLKEVEWKEVEQQEYDSIVETRAKLAAPKTKAGSKATPKVDESTAQAAFETFIQEWMTKLAEAEEFQRTQKVKVTQTPDGYSAEYVGYLPQRSTQVKKTEYEDTPFVGTVTYYERTLRCTGKTKEQALQGPFEQVGTSPVREIFRFTKGKWVY